MGWRLKEEYQTKIPVYKFRFGNGVQTHIEVVGSDGKIIRINFELNDEKGISNQNIEVLKERPKERFVEKKIGKESSIKMSVF